MQNKINTQITTQEVQISAWPAGVYLIIYKGDDGTVLTEKLIKTD